MDNPQHVTLRLAIVGHTNTGKTSLIRNLGRARNFGEVKDEASTTQGVNSLSHSSSTVTFEYIDTPGLEDAMSILATLDKAYPLNHRHQRQEEVKRLAEFILQAPHPDFEQEIKVLKQVLKADLMVYVVDTRLPFLPKFSDELTLILQSHKPILPILNFLHEGTYAEEWKTNLKAHGIHHYLEYDTITPPQKRRLYEQLALLFPNHYEAIRLVIGEEAAETKHIFNEAMGEAANLLLNLLSYQVTFKEETKEARVLKRLEKDISQLEKNCLNALLNLYRFNQEDVEYLALTIEGTRYTPDFLSGENLLNFSLHFGKGAGVGAGLFAGIDALAGFTTLGAATATGAIVGGLTNSFRFYGHHLLNKLRGKEIFCLNNKAILALMLRIITLIGLLNGRSHADLTPIFMKELNSAKEADTKTINDAMSDARGFLVTLIEESQKYRAYPEYTLLHGSSLSSRRQEAVNTLAKALKEHYQTTIL